MALVRWGTKSKYGHAALVVGWDPALSPECPVQIIEAAPGGVRMQWVALDAFRWSTDGPIHVTGDQRAKIITTAWNSLKSAYDWPSVLEFVPRFWNAKFKGYFAEHSDDHLFCSELVVWAYRQAGISLFPSHIDPRSIAPGAVSPGMLEPFCP